jgi:hypothetical protein
VGIILLLFVVFRPWMVATVAAALDVPTAVLLHRPLLLLLWIGFTFQMHVYEWPRKKKL